MAGVVCDVPAAGAVTIRLRTSLDGAAWGPWLEAPLEVAGRGTAAPAFTDARVDRRRPATYRSRPSGADGARTRPRSAGVRLVAIDPTEERRRRRARHRRGPPGRRRGGRRDLHSPAAAAATAPVIVTRARVGRRRVAALRVALLRAGEGRVRPPHRERQRRTRGHDAPGLVRASTRTTPRRCHWNDIGYNFLVDRFGTIYEGRYGGVARGVIGAQVDGFNTGSTGVSVLGTFIDQAPPAGTVAALERLLAWKLAVHGLDPTGTSTAHVRPADKYAIGATVTFPVIAGHRQANYTECPGNGSTRRCRRSAPTSPGAWARRSSRP